MSSPDPYSPHYAPDAVPSRPGVAGVGSGADFGADLYALYRAGRVRFPEYAARYAELVNRLVDVAPMVQGVSADAGSPAALRTLVELTEELYFAMREMTTSLRDTGPALVRIADDYLATDEAARAEFERYRADEAEIYYSPPRAVPPLRQPEPQS